MRPTANVNILGASPAATTPVTTSAAAYTPKSARRMQPHRPAAHAESGRATGDVAALAASIGAHNAGVDRAQVGGRLIACVGTTRCLTWQCRRGLQAAHALPAIAARELAAAQGGASEFNTESRSSFTNKVGGCRCGAMGCLCSLLGNVVPFTATTSPQAGVQSAVRRARVHTDSVGSSLQLDDGDARVYRSETYDAVSQRTICMSLIHCLATQ